MTLTTCKKCGEHHFESELQCKHCGIINRPNSPRRYASNAFLLGLALTGCGNKNEDTATTDTASEASSEPSAEPAVEPPYGVPDTGENEEEQQ